MHLFFVSRVLIILLRRRRKVSAYQGGGNTMKRAEVLKRQKSFLESEDSRRIMKEVEWTLRYNQVVEDLRAVESRDRVLSRI
jgi:hypothetical protein